MAESPMLVRGLGRTRCREDDTPFPGERRQACIRRSNISGLGFDVEHLCSHTAGEAAVEEEDEALGWDAREPLLNQLQGDGGIGQIAYVCIVRDELVRLRAMPRERDDYRVIRRAAAERLEFGRDALPRGLLVDDQCRRAPKGVGEKGLERYGIAARAGELADAGGGIPVDAYEEAAECHVRRIPSLSWRGGASLLMGGEVAGGWD